ncbi:EAL domain, c-di-GMP-specific phosphodiesterase class I (or its enzymatically inactive variant) [Marinospirillum celere]|uniref:EAL domain, c-di-GMP-specific phosphodiesterase class I (Or its enzymatically inactive variant) n=1 Tax=Marinospirillum celere TaxID=1122252 RepID=A0A1I1EM20_9GAMM|nr:EAL domain-containing protein [Marinospirillum celere]SFB87706.1 EAL domain, c-di-GMP-specific phosphodiesterase class I (or its enzymatically inactive variant) [Marinospirillum celere]
MATAFPQDGCKQCAEPLNFDFTFAYQPIVDVHAETIWGYEALVRGLGGESAWSVLSQVNDDNRYAFDQACRVKAISLAAQLKLDSILSINFLPNAVYEPAHCIRSTLKAAEEAGFPMDKIMFEITESEQVHDPAHLTNIFQYYNQQGFITALDDFGAGHAGLNLLSRFIPDLMKIDMHLVRDVDTNRTKQVITRGLVGICKELGIKVLAEGVETAAEAHFYRGLGVELMQGYYFAKPGFEILPEVRFR